MRARARGLSVRFAIFAGGVCRYYVVMKTTIFAKFVQILVKVEKVGKNK